MAGERLEKSISMLGAGVSILNDDRCFDDVDESTSYEALRRLERDCTTTTVKAVHHCQEKLTPMNKIDLCRAIS